MVSLREWETARPDEGSLLVEQSLAGFPAGRRLAEELATNAHFGETSTAQILTRKFTPR